MSINVNLVYTSVQYQIEKNLGSGYLDPAQFNSFANQANVELFAKYTKDFQDTQAITDKILPFIKKAVLPVDDSNGHMAYPSDYVNKIAIRAFDPDAVAEAQAVCDDDEPINYNKIKQIYVKLIDNNKLGVRLSSSYLSPDNYHPIAVWYDTYAQFYPIDIGVVQLDYLRKPLETVWGYTTDIEGLEVYDSGTSVDFEWPWQMRMELITTICGYFGISVREEELVQAAQLLKSQQA